jgi:phosphatidylglycerol:prolipoprotein diacylglycerol transferase
LIVQFPNIDPVAFRLGPFEVRWYGLMYVFGFVGGYFLIRWLAAKKRVSLPRDALDNLVSYLVIGVILGGRLGYVVFYNLPYYWNYPLEVFAVWHGGMSFHGALLGSILAGWWFSRRRAVPFYHLADLCAVAAPIGLGLGRTVILLTGSSTGGPPTLPGE